MLFFLKAIQIRRPREFDPSLAEGGDQPCHGLNEALKESPSLHRRRKPRFRFLDKGILSQYQPNV